MESLKEALMSQKEISENEAKEIIKEMKNKVSNGENPEEVLYDEGLEPDYFLEII